MSSNTNTDEMIKMYKRLFAVLGIMTLLGIAIVYVHFPVWAAVIVGLLIMAIKSKVVIDTFKTFITGRNSILIVFALTGIFFIVLLSLPLINQNNHIIGTEHTSYDLDLQNASSASNEHENHGEHGNGH